MAEDKKIRVSADSTPLQELRQNVQAVWNDFMKMEGNFKELAESTLSVIREQINLLEERNRLAEGALPKGQHLSPERQINEPVEPETKRELIDTNDNDRRDPEIKPEEPEVPGVKFRGGVEENDRGAESSTELSEPETKRELIDTPGTREIITASDQRGVGEGIEPQQPDIHGIIRELIQQLSQASAHEEIHTDDEGYVEREVGSLRDVENVQVVNQDILEGFLEGIFEELMNIASTLEKGERDAINQVLPTQDRREGYSPEPPKPPKGESGVGQGSREGGGMKMPTSVSDLLRLLPGGAAIASLLLANSQQANYEAGQYSAQNEYQRRNQEYSHWMTKMLTFGASSAEGQRREVGRMSAQQNDQALKEYSALHNSSWEDSFAKQLGASYSDPDDLKAVTSYSDLSAREQNSSTERLLSKVNDAILGAEEKILGWTGIEREEWGEAKERREQRDEIKQYEESDDPSITREEFHNWASRTLGMNMTDYISRITSLERAGVKSENTTMEDMNQLLMSQRIRGVSDQESSEVLSRTRYDRSDFTGAKVVQALDTSLQDQGYDNQYIASVLGEHLTNFNRIADKVLSKTGSIDTEGIIHSMTAMQKATGMEGRQLERVQEAVAGGVSQDDVSQALLMRTVQQMYNGELTLPEVYAKMEGMGEDTELQSQYLARIRKMSNGNKTQEQMMLKQIFPGLSYSDVIAISGEPLDVAQEMLREQMTDPVKYSESDSAATVSPSEASSAGTTNRQMVDGTAQILKEEGTSIREVLENLTKPIPVVIMSGLGDGSRVNPQDIVDFHQQVKEISLSPEAAATIGRALASSLDGLTFITE